MPLSASLFSPKPFGAHLKPTRLPARTSLWVENSGNELSRLKSAQKKTLRPDRIKLDQNESPLGPDSRYPTQTEDLATRNALSQRSGVPPSRIQLVPGSSYGIAFVMVMLGRHGRMIVADTTSPPFLHYGRLANSDRHASHEPVQIPMCKDGSHDLDAMLEAIHANVQDGKKPFPIVVEPNNPTGTAVGKERLQTFLRKLPKEVVLVLDRAYAAFQSDALELSEVFETHPKTIALESASKGYAAANLRAGAVLTGDDKIHNQLLELVPDCSLSSKTLQTYGDLIRNPHLTTRLKAWSDRSRAQFTDAGFDYFPSATNFVAVRVKAHPDLVMRQLADKNIDVKSGTEYGPAMSDRVRISFGTDAENEQVIKALHPYTKRRRKTFSDVGSRIF